MFTAIKIDAFLENIVSGDNLFALGGRTVRLDNMGDALVHQIILLVPFPVLKDGFDGTHAHNEYESNEGAIWLKGGHGAPPH